MRTALRGLARLAPEPSKRPEILSAVTPLMLGQDALTASAAVRAFAAWDGGKGTRR